MSDHHNEQQLHRAHAQHRALLHRDAARRLGAADRHDALGRLRLLPDAAAQGPGHSGPAGPGAVSLARRQRREDRAAGHAPDRREDCRERQGREDRIEHPHRHHGGLHHAGRGHARHRQGVRRHQAEARLDHRPAGRRRPDRLRQGLRRHGGADADRGQPARSPTPRSRARAQALRKEIEATRAAAGPAASPRVTLVQGLPALVPAELVRRPLRLFAEAATADGVLRDAQSDHRPGIRRRRRARRTKTMRRSRRTSQRFTRERLRASEFHPDAWPVAVIRDPAETRRRAWPRSPATNTATASSTTTPI